MSALAVWIHNFIQLAQKTLRFIRILSQSPLTTIEVITSHALLLCKKSNVTAQRQVRPTNGSKQCKGAKGNPPKQPWVSAAPLCLRHLRCVNGDRKPEENQYTRQSSHHQSVTAL